tara:strand:+ start:40 stop:327 length:288 start_codon:yes stop_codon:yes gene_type:complete
MKKKIELNNHQYDSLPIPIDKENVETLLRHIWIELFLEKSNVASLDKVSFSKQEDNIIINFDTHTSDWVSTYYKRTQYKLEKIGVVKEQKNKSLD